MSKVFVDEEAGEMLCSECHGEGFIIDEVGIKANDYRRIPVKNICQKCLGAGKVDWLENICGKDHVVMNVNIERPEVLYGESINPIKVKTGKVKIWGQKTPKR